MERITVYGLPLNPLSLLEQLAGRSFCVSYGTRKKLGRQLEDAIRLVGHGGILLVDNGAYTLWRRGEDSVSQAYIEGFETWAQEILDRCPQAVAVIPDVIGGSIEENERLMLETALPSDRCMAIWHLNEPIWYLLNLCERYGWIGFGSAGEYASAEGPKWHARMREAFAAIAAWEEEYRGCYVRPRIHLMRAQKHAHLYPVDSSDSTNVAVNHNKQRRSGHPIAEFAARIDAKVQAVAGPPAEFQLKRPLLEHLETAEWERNMQLELLLYRFLENFELVRVEKKIAAGYDFPRKGLDISAPCAYSLPVPEKFDLEDSAWRPRARSPPSPLPMPSSWLSS